MVFPMPPTAASRSSTVTGIPRSDNRQAAEIPAGPAPRTTTCGLDTLGDNEVIEVHRKRERTEREMEGLGDAEALGEPSAHLSRRRERHVIRIANREFSEQQ